MQVPSCFQTRNHFPLRGTSAFAVLHYVHWERHHSVMPVSPAKLPDLHWEPARASKRLSSAYKKLNPRQQMYMNPWNDSSGFNLVFISLWFGVCLFACFLTFMKSISPRIADLEHLLIICLPWLCCTFRAGTGNADHTHLRSRQFILCSLLLGSLYYSFLSQSPISPEKVSQTFPNCFLSTSPHPNNTDAPYLSVCSS